VSSLRLSNGSQGKILEETSRGGCPCPISSNVDGGGRILSVFPIFFYLIMKIVQEYTKISTISIKAFKTELLNKFNSRSPCFTASSSQKHWCHLYDSTIYNCHASLRL